MSRTQAEWDALFATNEAGTITPAKLRAFVDTTYVQNKYLLAASTVNDAGPVHMKTDDALAELQAMVPLSLVLNAVTQDELDTRINRFRDMQFDHLVSVGTAAVDGSHPVADTTSQSILAAIPPAVDLTTAIALIGDSTHGLGKVILGHSASPANHFHTDTGIGGNAFVFTGTSPPVTLVDCCQAANDILTSLLAHYAAATGTDASDTDLPVVTDGTSISGNGTNASPIALIGSLGVNVKQGGSSVVVGAATLNFTGDVSVSSAGGGTATVNIVPDTDTIHTDGTTIGGDGSLSTPLEVIGSIVNVQQSGSPVVTGATVLNFTGDVNVTNPSGTTATINITANAQNGTVVTDGTTIGGDGSIATPVTLIGSITNVKQDGSVVVAGAKNLNFTGDAVVTASGDQATINVTATAGTVITDGTTIGGNGSLAQPLTVIGSILDISSNGTPTVTDTSLLNFTGGVTVTPGPSNSAVINILAQTQPTFWIDVTLAPYSADNTGVADATAAIQSAINAAIAANKPVYFPKGTYKLTQAGTYGGYPYCILMHDLSKLSLIGDRALFTYPSQSTYGFLFYNNATKISFTGLAFQGANDNNYLTNIYWAIFCAASCEDIEISHCEFNQCPSILYGQDNVVNGRALITHNRFMNVPNGMVASYRSVISNNIFHNDAKVGTRSHFIYLYGPIDGCAITGNVFRRSDSRTGSYAIQIRAGSSRYGYKHSFTITGNQFHDCTQCMWLGSDDATNVAGFTVTGNNFFNSGSCVLLMGNRNSNVTGNTAEYSWEFPTQSAACFEVNYVSGRSSSDVVNITGNTIVNRHPFFGIVTVNTLPTAGDTVVVGSQTYTWRTSASVAGEVTIGGSTQVAAANLQNEIQGYGLTTPNKVLREPTDCMHSAQPYDGANTNDVVIASAATFTLTATGTAVAITAVVDHSQVGGAGILLNRTRWVRLTGNTIQDVQLGISVTGSMAPVVHTNTLIGCNLRAHGNVLSSYRSNTFPLSPYREKFQPRPYRLMQIDDGFPVIDGNDYGQIIGDEYENIAYGGAGGQVLVGTGHAWVPFYYGIDNTVGGTGQPETLNWRWNDGDTVKLFNGSTLFTFTFTRTSPGANQFNSADSFLALVNGSTSGTLTAAYANYVNVGGSVNQKLLIEITHVAGGTVGNTCYIQVDRPSTGGADFKSLRMCGVILIDRHPGGDLTDLCYFRGGSAAADKTVIWSPMVSTMRGVHVQGIDAASQSLAPIAYQADITPGICSVISHSAAVSGTEQFFFRCH